MIIVSTMPNKYTKICDIYLTQKIKCDQINNGPNPVKPQCELVNILYKNCLDYQRKKLKSMDTT